MPSISVWIMIALGGISAALGGYVLIQRNTITRIEGELSEAMRVAKANQLAADQALADATRTADALGAAGRTQQQEAARLAPTRQVIYATPNADYANCLRHPGVVSLRAVADGGGLPAPASAGGNNGRPARASDAARSARLQRVSRVGG